MAKWMTVEKVFDSGEAEIIAAVLRGAGIPVEIVSDSAGGWFPELVKLRGAEVRVPDDRYEEAVELLESAPEYEDDR